MKARESRSFWGSVRRFLLWGVSLYAMLIAFYLLVFRLRSQRVNDAVCVFNKYVLNPVMMFMDRPHLYASVLRHKGRRSGKEYAIPVVAQPIKGGYVVPLAYGEKVDWLKNVRASGQCTIEARDGVHTLGKPEVIATEEALAAMSPRARMMFRAFGHERCLKLERLPDAPVRAA